MRIDLPFYIILTKTFGSVHSSTNSHSTHFFIYMLCLHLKDQTFNAFDHWLILYHQNNYKNYFKNIITRNVIFILFFFSNLRRFTQTSTVISCWLNKPFRDYLLSFHYIALPDLCPEISFFSYSLFLSSHFEIRAHLHSNNYHQLLSQIRFSFADNYDIRQ